MKYCTKASHRGLLFFCVFCLLGNGARSGLSHSLVLRVLAAGAGLLDGALLAHWHLLVDHVAVGGQRVLLRGDRRNAHSVLGFVEHRTAHRLLRFLARRRRVDHFLGLKQDIVHATCAVAGHAATHSVHEVCVHGHLCGVDEFVGAFSCQS